MERFLQSIEEKPSATISIPNRSPLKFFLLVFALTVPFWVIGALARFQLLPGVPVAALAVVCPVLAAIILVYRESKLAGVKALLMRSFDYKRIAAKVWFVPILFLLPVVAVLSFMTTRAMGVPIPAPHVAIMPTLELLALFFVAALGEELGWSGYALDPMQKRLNALSAGLLLGLVWAAWHIVPLLQTHRTLDWIAWWCVGTVTLRVVMVWLFNNTGKSVFAAALFHAASNVCWQSFPIHGSYFDPRINGLFMLGVAAVVTIVNGPRTLAKRGTT
jgi:CAAX protease family protein